MLHGAGLWVARIGLLTAFVLHIAATISLVRENKAARKPYEHEATIQATKASLTMLITGLTILAFVIFHILHFTVRIGNEFGNPELYTDQAFLLATGTVRHDAWKMVIDGFSVWYVSLFYVIAMTLLCTHLRHGVQSIFQTLGWRSKRSASAIDLFAKAYAVIIWVGFVSIPIAVLLFELRP